MHAVGGGIIREREINMMEAIEAIEQAFLQLSFAIKLLTHIELGNLDKDVFDAEVQVNLSKRNLVFGQNTFKTADDVILAAQNNYSITLGFTALVLDRALEGTGLRRDLQDGDPDRDIRALVYMVRCAFAHDMMHPRWEARGSAFARELRIDLPSEPLIVDMTALHGLPFEDSHIGGVETYFEIRAEVERIVRRAAAR